MVPLSPPRGWLNSASPLHVKLLGTECPSTMANRANRKGAGAGVKHWECDLCHCRYNSAASSTCEICKAPRPRVKFALCVDGRYFLCKLHSSSFEGCVKVREISTGSEEAISNLSIIETDGTVEESIVDAVSIYLARGQPAGLEVPGIPSVNPVTKLEPKPNASSPLPNPGLSLFDTVLKNASSVAYNTKTGQYVSLDSLDLYAEAEDSMIKRSLGYVNFMMQEQIVMKRVVKEVVMRRSQAYLYDKSADLDINRNEWEKSVDCPVCERIYPVSQMPGQISFKAVARWKAKRGVTIAPNDHRIDPCRIHNAVKLCSFCTQFFDRDASDLVDKERLKAEVGVDNIGMHGPLNCSRSVLKTISRTRAQNQKSLEDRPLSRMRNRLALEQLKQKGLNKDKDSRFIKFNNQILDQSKGGTYLREKYAQSAAGLLLTQEVKSAKLSRVLLDPVAPVASLAKSKSAKAKEVKEPVWGKGSARTPIRSSSSEAVRRSKPSSVLSPVKKPKLKKKKKRTLESPIPETNSTVAIDIPDTHSTSRPLLLNPSESGREGEQGALAESKRERRAVRRSRPAAQPLILKISGLGTEGGGATVMEVEVGTSMAKARTGITGECEGARPAVELKGLLRNIHLRTVPTEDFSDRQGEVAVMPTSPRGQISREKGTAKASTIPDTRETKQSKAKSLKQEIDNGQSPPKTQFADAKSSPGAGENHQTVGNGLSRRIKTPSEKKHGSKNAETRLSTNTGSPLPLSKSDSNISSLSSGKGQGHASVPEMTKHDGWIRGSFDGLMGQEIEDEDEVLMGEPVCVGSDDEVDEVVDEEVSEEEQVLDDDNYELDFEENDEFAEEAGEGGWGEADSLMDHYDWATGGAYEPPDDGNIDDESCRTGADRYSPNREPRLSQTATERIKLLSRGSAGGLRPGSMRNSASGTMRDPKDLRERMQLISRGSSDGMVSPLPSPTKGHFATVSRKNGASHKMQGGGQAGKETQTRSSVIRKVKSMKGAPTRING